MSLSAESELVMQVIRYGFAELDDYFVGNISARERIGSNRHRCGHKKPKYEIYEDYFFRFSALFLSL